MSTLNLNLHIGKTWKDTLQSAFSYLRRIPFVVQDTFSFGDFDPNINWNGMTVSAVNIFKARYLKIGNMLWVTFYITATLAAPLAQVIYITVPGTAPIGDNNANRVQGDLFWTANAGVSESGRWVFYPGFNVLECGRFAAAYGAGVSIFALNTFLEVQ